ncbi:MAG: multidrug efflux SMR transporter [Marinibacterium sp.]|nr:multidrug efflux SMR transporter [Marinibacterium sp.]
MHWLILFIAGLFETGWAVGLKYSDGLTRFWPTVFTAVTFLISLTLLGVALRSVPLGTGYAIWAGIGMVGTAVVGILAFNEPATAGRLICVGLILAGIVGLKLVEQT